MDALDIDLGFARSLCGRKAVDHHATNLHQGTAQNPSPATDFLASVDHGRELNRRTAGLRPATAARRIPVSQLNRAWFLTLTSSTPTYSSPNELLPDGCSARSMNATKRSARSGMGRSADVRPHRQLHRYGRRPRRAAIRPRSGIGDFRSRRRPCCRGPRLVRRWRPH